VREAVRIVAGEIVAGELGAKMGTETGMRTAEGRGGGGGA
jgi:hypothetical protein